MNVAGTFLPARSQLWFGRASAVVTHDRSLRSPLRKMSAASGAETTRDARDAIAGLIDGALEAGRALRSAQGSIRTRSAAAMSRSDIGLSPDGSLSPTTGMPQEVDEPIAEVAALGSVSSGRIVVNGIEVGIDVHRHSLRNVLERIEASGAGVTTGLWARGEKAFVRSDSASGDLVLDSNGTGLFEALQMPRGTRRPRSAAGVGRQQARATSRSFEALAQALNELFDRPSRGLQASTMLDQVRQEVERAVADAVGGDGPRFQAGSGITFDFSEGATSVLDLSGESRIRFEHALLTQGREAGIYSLFLGNTSSGDNGLLEELVGGLQRTLDDSGQGLNAVGSRLDLWL